MSTDICWLSRRVSTDFSCTIPHVLFTFPGQRESGILDPWLLPQVHIWCSEFDLCYQSKPKTKGVIIRSAGLGLQFETTQALHDSCYHKRSRKRVTLCLCLAGPVKEHYLSIVKVPESRSNLFQLPAHSCVITYDWNFVNSKIRPKQNVCVFPVTRPTLL